MYCTLSFCFNKYNIAKYYKPNLLNDVYNICLFLTYQLRCPWTKVYPLYCKSFRVSLKLTRFGVGNQLKKSEKKNCDFSWYDKDRG